MRILTIAMMLACGPAMAGVEVTPEEPTPEEIATSLAECAGFWLAYSELIREESPQTADLAEGVARGGRLSAAMMASMFADTPKQWADGIAGSHAIYWRSMLFDNITSDEETKAQAEWCGTLNPLQTMIIQGLRNKANGVD